MKKMSTRMVVEAGIMIALAQVLSYFKVYESPYGGSVTAGSMIPIVIFAIRWGSKPGLLAGLVFGILQFLLGPKYSYHPLSILLDYLLPFASIGLAGLFKKNLATNLVSTFIAMFARFMFHFASGFIVWASTTPEGQNVYLYSLVYNASYMLPEFVISAILLSLLYVPLKRFILENRLRTEA
ncbi:MAG: putative proton-coupled thiamine transporter YuaJ [Eubacterium sp.]|nr:putative proton-coupled thiamine transporter YuaJ [Eubacterium sp.]